MLQCRMAQTVCLRFYDGVNRAAHATEPCHLDAAFSLAGCKEAFLEAEVDTWPARVAM